MLLKIFKKSKKCLSLIRILTDDLQNDRESFNPLHYAVRHTNDRKMCQLFLPIVSSLEEITMYMYVII